VSKSIRTIAFPYRRQIPPPSAPSSIISGKSVVKGDNSNHQQHGTISDKPRLVARGSISEGAAEGASEGAGEGIGEAATNKLLEKHPLSRNAIIAIVIASVVVLLL